MAWKIKSATIDAILHAARHTHPNEFIALLGGNKKEQIIEELVILPAIFGREHALLHTGLLPPNSKTVGSVHSHPGYSNEPSEEDLDTFQDLGTIHLIVCEPYSISTIAAYDTNGQKTRFEITE